MRDNPNMPRDIRAVEFDETRYFAPEFLEKHRIRRILGTYVADFSSYTYCCELTPSLYLTGVHFSIEHDGDVSDEVREAADCELIDCGGPEDFYLHVRSAQKLRSVKFEDDPEETDEEAMEAAREYFQGNWPF